MITNYISYHTQLAILQGCVSDKCRKKVVEMDGQYRCEKCNITADTFKYCLQLWVSNGHRIYDIIDSRICLGRIERSDRNILDYNVRGYSGEIAGCKCKTTWRNATDSGTKLRFIF